LFSLVLAPPCRSALLCRKFPEAPPRGYTSTQPNNVSLLALQLIQQLVLLFLALQRPSESPRPCWQLVGTLEEWPLVGTVEEWPRRPQVSDGRAGLGDVHNSQPATPIRSHSGEQARLWKETPLVRTAHLSMSSTRRIRRNPCSPRHRWYPSPCFRTPRGS
jgi:hypothetical protein